MAHYRSQSKMGYYPTPAHLVPLIAQYLHAQDPGNCRILDPCAGTGAALADLGAQLGIPGLYANELDSERAEECREAGLYVAVGDALEELKATDRSFSALFLNPPYDNYGFGEGRSELKFLNTLRYLRRDGIAILIIPLHVLQENEFKERLPSQLKDIFICRFPQADFQDFGQAVVFGRRCSGKSPAENANYLRQLRRPAELGDGVMPAHGQYEVPAVDLQGRFTFLSKNLDAQTARELCVQPAAQRLINEGLVKASRPKLRSLMRLRAGHLAVLLATGRINGWYRSQEDHLLAVAGTTRVDTHKTVETEEDRKVERIRYTPTPSVRALDITASLAEEKLVVINYR